MHAPLLFSGFDVHRVNWPKDAQFLNAPAPLPALKNVAQQVKKALEQPLSGESLPQRVRPHTRVCVVLDDLCYPAPGMANDCRREMLEATVQLLTALGVKADRLSVKVGTGLNRQWRPTELVDILGPIAQRLAIECHDAEEVGGHVRVGDGEGFEIARKVVEADLIIYLNVVTMPLQAGLSGLLMGTSSYKTARALAAPTFFEEDAPFSHGSSMKRMHDQVGEALQKKVPVFQVSAVLNNDFWDERFRSLWEFSGEPGRRLQLWNALPEAVRHRATRLMKAQYRPHALFAGPTSEVAPRAYAAFLQQHEVPVEGESDVVVLGLPNVGPHSFGTSQNPVLAAHLGLGLLSQFVTTRPLLRQGGVFILANPLTPSFDAKAHLPYQEFYERVLRHEKEPQAIFERFEPYFAGRPEFVLNYQRRFAFHGTHPLYSWYQCTPARKRAGKIMVAHGDPRACARLGFMPTNDVGEALQKAKEWLGLEKPKVTVLNVPPPFFVGLP